MNIAELFVNLGIKGAAQTGKALKGVKEGLGEVKSMSLEAKAAIFGVVYGLERLMSASAQQGTNLLNFNSLTGLSTQRLQEWQYAARQAGVAGEELTGSVKAVQSNMTAMLLGKGQPGGWGMVSNQLLKMGDKLDESKVRDPFYVMEKLQKFAQAVPQDVGNDMLKTFGLSEGVIAGMRRNSFNPAAFAAAPKYSDNEVGRLNKVDVAWSNLGNKIQMAMGHFTSKHGMSLVKDLSDVTSSVVRLSEAFIQLAERVKVFKIIGEVFKGWSLIFEKSAEGVDTLGDKKASKMGAIFSGVGEAWKGMQLDEKEKNADYQKELMQRFGITPPTPAGAAAGAAAPITNNNTFNFQHDGKDHAKVGNSVEKAVNKVYRAKTTSGQVN